MIRLICYGLQDSSAYPQKTGSNHWVGKDAPDRASHPKRWALEA
jgi:hypothetical protein